VVVDETASRMDRYTDQAYITNKLTQIKTDPENSLW
jgi:hypothetical protein